MDRRLLCFAALACLICGGLQAQTLSYSPLNPQAGDLVTFTISTFDCSSSMDTAVTAPGPGNGAIRFTITQGCVCLATPAPITFHEEVGPLAFGSYDVEIYHRFSDEDPACCEGGCTPQLFSRSTLTVSPNEGVVLRQGRFRVQADWSAPGFGEGTARGVPLTDESGYFTFFGPTNVEMIVKVLNCCTVNQRYWVFLAGLTNVGVTVHVEDTLTGHLETYSNPLGQTFQSVIDTASFATCP